MYGRPEVQFLLGTQIFSLSHARDMLITSFLISSPSLKCIIFLYSSYDLFAFITFKLKCVHNIVHSLFVIIVNFSRPTANPFECLVLLWVIILNFLFKPRSSCRK